MERRRTRLPLVVASLAASLFFGLSGDYTIHSAEVIPAAQGVIGGGEELIYEVGWTIFKLGTIRIRTHPDYSAKAYIDSYEALPFADLHAVHSTQMDSSFLSLASLSNEKKDDGWRGLAYVRDDAHSRLFIEETWQKGPTSPPDRRLVRDTISMPSMVFADGLSLLYLTRALARSTRTVVVPTVLSGSLGETTFSFSNRKTTESIDAIDDPVRVTEVQGLTTATGVFGMTGEFTGWFSDDSAAVPIKGKLKVLLGNVSIELIQWKRGGWSPPG